MLCKPNNTYGEWLPGEITKGFIMKCCLLKLECEIADCIPTYNSDKVLVPFT
jgi:hypothetical protein